LTGCERQSLEHEASLLHLRTAEKGAEKTAVSCVAVCV
jgi:hypothetical protein